LDSIVCVKRVPSTTTRVQVGPDGRTLDPSGVEYILNPYDEFAVEEALKQKEAAGSGSVAAISFGDPAAQKELRTVLAMGADSALLDIPCISEVVEMQVADGKVVCVREVEGGRETVEAPLPCAITCQKGLNEPRYASLKGIMAAKKKPLESQEVAIEKHEVEVLDMTMPPARPAGRILGEGAAAVPALITALREEAKVW
jgi:electron transfer flavoprotein beta subunit